MTHVRTTLTSTPSKYTFRFSSETHDLRPLSLTDYQFLRFNVDTPLESVILWQTFYDGDRTDEIELVAIAVLAIGVHVKGYGADLSRRPVLARNQD